MNVENPAEDLIASLKGSRDRVASLVSEIDGVVRELRGEAASLQEHAEYMRDDAGLARESEGVFSALDGLMVFDPTILDDSLDFLDRAIHEAEKYLV